MKLINFVTLFLTLMLIAMIGCNQNTGPSSKVIVIALDNFGIEDFSCHKEGDLPTLSSLCSESVRFNHAWTTSTSSPVALASILTSQFPKKIGYQNPDAEYLPPNSFTLPKQILKTKTATAFFSSGFPVLSRTGLGIGFDIFDDNIDSTLLFRPLKKNIELFKTWYGDNVRENFLAVFYASDLMAIERTTRTETKEARPGNYESQLEELDDALAELMSFMKKHEKWNDTWIILTGLNGRANREDLGAAEEPIPQSLLHSDRTQVSLLIKPPTKPRDRGLDWDIDENVSLIDVGNLLQTIFRLKPTCDECVNLADAIKNVSIEHKLRGLPIEAPFLNQDKTLIAHAFRFENWLGILGPKHTFYNSLTDRLENNKIFDPKQLPSDIRNYYFEFFKKTTSLSSTFKPSNEFITTEHIKEELDSNFLQFPNKIEPKKVSYLCKEVDLNTKESDLKTKKCNNTLYTKFADFAASNYQDQNAKKIFLRELAAFEKSRQAGLWAYTNFNSQFAYLSPDELLHFVDFYLNREDLKSLKKEARQIAVYELLQMDEVVK